MVQDVEYIKKVRANIKEKLLKAGFKSVRNDDTLEIALFDILQAPPNTTIVLNYGDTNRDVDSVFLYAADITVVYKLEDAQEFNISMPLENIVNADIVVTSQTDIADKNTVYNQLIGYGYTGKKKKHTSNNDVIELTPPKNSTISINNVHINRKVQYVTLYDYFIVVVYADDGNLFEATIEYNDIQNFNLS